MLRTHPTGLHINVVPGRGQQSGAEKLPGYASARVRVQVGGVPPTLSPTLTVPPTHPHTLTHIQHRPKILLLLIYIYLLYIYVYVIVIIIFYYFTLLERDGVFTRWRVFNQNDFYRNHCT